MEKIIERLAAELAKYEFNELEGILFGMPFIKAYNMLKGFNLEMSKCMCNKELLSLQITFDFNYKHISGTIFRTDDGGCELHEMVSVWDDKSSSPIIECLEMEC